jgi:hypothetical protein
MRGQLALAMIALTACASARPGSAILSGPPETPIGTSAVRMRAPDGTTVNLIAFPLDRVWHALPAVFDSLGVPINQLDPVHHVMGNSGFKVHKRLGNVALSKFIDCGSTQGFPSADEYDVSLSVLTQIEPDKSGQTSIATRIAAAGRPMAFAGEYTSCTTKGLLESSIADGVTRQLQR